jgi:hypothetical protein
MPEATGTSPGHKQQGRSHSHKRQATTAPSHSHSHKPPQTPARATATSHSHSHSRKLQATSHKPRATSHNHKPQATPYYKRIQELKMNLGSTGEGIVGKTKNEIVIQGMSRRDPPTCFNVLFCICSALFVCFLLRLWWVCWHSVGCNTSLYFFICILSLYLFISPSVSLPLLYKSFFFLIIENALKSNRIQQTLFNLISV